jgi:hypothetical protein
VVRAGQIVFFGADALATMENATWKEAVIPDNESPNGIIPNTVAAVTDSGSQTVAINVLGGFAAPIQRRNIETNAINCPQ